MKNLKDLSEKASEINQTHMLHFLLWQEQMYLFFPMNTEKIAALTFNTPNGNWSLQTLFFMCIKNPNQCKNLETSSKGKKEE